MQKEERNIILAVTILVSAILIVAVIGYLTLGKTSDIIQGEAEATEYRVSSKVPGRLYELRVREGDKVEAGDTLAIIEAPDVEAKLVQAQAVRNAAEAQKTKAQKGTREEQKQTAYEMWKKSQAGLEIAQKSFDRINNLCDEGVVTEQKRDEFQANLKASKATERAAEAQYYMALNGAQTEDKLMAEAQLSQAEGVVAEVNSYKNETFLIASQAGEVTEIFPHIGELIGTGAPIMNIAMLDKMWVSFNMREDYLKDFEINKTIDAYIPALNTNIQLRIYYIKDLGTFAVWKATKTTDQYDLKTFEVRAEPLTTIKDFRPGMSVIIRKN